MDNINPRGARCVHMCLKYTGNNNIDSQALPLGVIYRSEKVSFDFEYLTRNGIPGLLQLVPGDPSSVVEIGLGQLNFRLWPKSPENIFTWASATLHRIIHDVPFPIVLWGPKQSHATGIVTSCLAWLLGLDLNDTFGEFMLGDGAQEGFFGRFVKAVRDAGGIVAALNIQPATISLFHEKLTSLQMDFVPYQALIDSSAAELHECMSKAIVKPKSKRFSSLFNLQQLVEDYPFVEPKRQKAKPMDLELTHAKRVTFIRHGRSLAQGVHNRQRRQDPNLLDAALSPTGVHEAKCTGAFFHPQNYGPIDLIVTSPLTRALQTACHLFSDKLHDDTPIIACSLVCELGPIPENHGRPIKQLQKDSKLGNLRRFQSISFDQLPDNWPVQPGKQGNENIRHKFSNWLCNVQATNIVVVAHFNLIQVMLGKGLKVQNCYPLQTTFDGVTFALY